MMKTHLFFGFAFLASIFCNAQNLLTKSEKEILAQRAEILLRDYYTKLNQLGEADYYEGDYELEKFFESNQVMVCNDLFPQILKTDFPVNDYFELVDKWFQRGVSFELSNVKILPYQITTENNELVVACLVKRKYLVKDVNYKSTKELIYLIKFPKSSQSSDFVQPLIVRASFYNPRRR